MRFFSTLLASVLGTLIALGVVVIFCVALFLGLAATTETTPSVEAGSVLSAKLSGTIPERTIDTPFNRLISPERAPDLRTYKRAVRNAAQDSRIEALWLEPHGVRASWATLGELRSVLKEFRSSGKPIVAYSGTNGFTEKDYYLASVADSIYAPPEAYFELNGFVLSSAFYQDLLTRIGVEPMVVRAGKYKGAVEPFTRKEYSSANEAQLEALLDDVNRIFLDSTTANRGLPPDSLQQLILQGSVFTAEEGHHTGLIDGLRFRDDLRDSLQHQIDDPDAEALTTIGAGRYARIPPGDIGPEPEGPSEIAVVYAVGAITSGESRSAPGSPLEQETVGSATFAEAMESAVDNENAKAIVLRINSPGGLVTASDVMWNSVRAAQKEKPVIVSMGDYAASGGYYIAAPADTIVANPLSITGSIGVFGLYFNTNNLFEEELGITFDRVQTGPFADMFSGVRDFRDEERERLSSVIDGMYQEFLSKVAEGRGMTTAKVNQVAQGRVWTGSQAKEVGLVDLNGSLETAIDVAAERAGLDPDAYTTTIYPRPRPFVEQLADAFRYPTQVFWHWMGGSERHELYKQMKRLESLARQNGSVQARLPVDLQIY